MQFCKNCYYNVQITQLLLLHTETFRDYNTYSDTGSMLGTTICTKLAWVLFTVFKSQAQF